MGGTASPKAGQGLGDASESRKLGGPCTACRQLNRLGSAVPGNSNAISGKETKYLKDKIHGVREGAA